MVLDIAEVPSVETVQPIEKMKPQMYGCLVEKCNRSYKTIQGLQHHFKHSKAHDHHGHGTPTTTQATITPKNKKSKHRHKLVKVKLTQTPVIQAPEPLTFEEAQKMVQLDVNGLVVRIGINDSLDVIACNSSTPILESDLNLPPHHSQSILSTPKFISPESIPLIQLPEASFRRLPDYSISDAPPRPNAYIRFIEKSTEELDGEVEYDVDEEDSAWLAIVNKRRESVGLAPVPVDSLELLMDRFEKESYFQATQVEDTGALGSDNTHNRPISMDDDAVCCICMDGECQNTNVILFCDMCNLAVHQDCYGVPYIPEGQWLCRRCLQSPSRAVSCVLCPNQGGAFKQTDRGDWAHVVCALWIPEVRFANTVFLEPIDSIEAVPAARWRLTCVICRQRGVGACIQCHRASCYVAFHVTCAQHYGLYMRMQTVPQSDVSKVQLGLLTQTGANQQPVLVQKIAYCEQHSPPDHQIVKKEPTNLPNNRKQNRNNEKRTKNTQQQCGVSESGAPIILLPTIPPERIQEIGALVQIQKKSQFVQRLIAYWMLKRQFRNGVPLLRRLQSSSSSGGSCGVNHRVGGAASGGVGNAVDTNELYQQLKYWQCLRQDLERARLLCELVRKREKLKAELIRSTERYLNVQLHPLQSSLLKVISLLSSKDTSDIFGEPVDPEEVPDYSSVVTDPMDLSTMKAKCERGQYEDVDDLEKDFELIIANCLKYNNRETMFYRAGIKMREQGRVVLRLGKDELEKAGLLKKAVKDDLLLVEKKVVSKKLKVETLPEKQPPEIVSVPIEDPLEIDRRLLQMQEQRKTSKNLVTILTTLEVLLIQSQNLKHGLARAKRVKTIRNEIIQIKKFQKETLEEKSVVKTVVIEDSKSKIEDRAMDLSSTKCSNMKASSTVSVGNLSFNLDLELSGSSQGVNRRTAVLFTRKALHQSSGSTSSTLKKKNKGKPSPVKNDDLVEDKKVFKDYLLKEKDKCPEEDGKRKDIKEQQGVARAVKRGASRPDSTSRSSVETSPKILRRTNTSESSAVKETPTKSPSTKDKALGNEAPATKSSTKMISTAEFSDTNKDEDITDALKSSTLATIPDSFRVYRDTTGCKKGDKGVSRVAEKQRSRAGTRHTRSAGVQNLLSTDDDEDDELMTEHDSDIDDDDDDDDDDDEECSSDSSSSVSTCYSHTLSELEDISHPQESTTKLPKKESNTMQKKQSMLKSFQLVWAKCRGYPWYPALIIDPSTPPGGVVHRGVPLPGPPTEVLALRTNVSANNPGQDLYLILFFDAKRTWQWLTHDKLEIMDLLEDEHKTNEPRKPADRKAVKRAYQHAVNYVKQITQGVKKDDTTAKGASNSKSSGSNPAADNNNHTAQSEDKTTPANNSNIAS